MQILSTAEYPDPGSAQSAISFDPGSVTGPSTGIDFKVDVHRKNSSDSSDSVVYGAQQEDTTTTGWTASGKKRPIAVVEKENITEAVVVTEAGTSSSKSRDGGQVRKSSKRSNKKRRAEEQSTENELKKEEKSRKTSSSSDSRNSNSSEGSSHGDSSSSTTSSSNGRNDGIYKYDSSGSSSSSSARFSTLKSGNTNAGGEGHSGWGVEPDTKSRKGAKGSDIKSDQSKKRRKKNSHPVTSEGIVADPLASSTSLPPESVIEMEEQLDPLQDNSVVSSSSGAKKKRLPSARLQRQVNSPHHCDLPFPATTLRSPLFRSPWTRTRSTWWSTHTSACCTMTSDKGTTTAAPTQRRRARIRPTSRWATHPPPISTTTSTISTECGRPLPTTPQSPNWPLASTFPRRRRPESSSSCNHPRLRCARTPIPQCLRYNCRSPPRPWPRRIPARSGDSPRVERRRQGAKESVQRVLLAVWIVPERLCDELKVPLWTPATCPSPRTCPHSRTAWRRSPGDELAAPFLRRARVYRGIRI